MLRLLGALVLVVAILGPVLLEFGLLENAGMFRDLIALEMKAFSELTDYVRGMVSSRP